MKPFRFAAVVLAVIMLSASIVNAQGRSDNGNKGGNKGGNSQGPKADRGPSQKPSTTTSPANTTHGAGSSAKPTTARVGTVSGAKANAKTTPQAATLTPRTTSGTNRTSTSTATASSPTSSTSTATAGTGAIGSTVTPPPNALTTKLSKNPNLLAKVQSMLPEGTTLNEATTGFRNQGQFIAALEVSTTRNISFTDLQEAMTVNGLSLGQAVKQIQSAPATGDTTSPTTGTSTVAPTGTSSTASSSTSTQTSTRTKRTR